MNRNTLKILTGTLGMLLGACTQTPNGPNSPAPTAPKDASVVAYWPNLPSVNDTYPTLQAQDTITGPEYNQAITFGSTSYTCKRTPYNMVRSSENFVVPTANNIFWPGALLQGKTLQGNLSDVRGLNIMERGPLTLVTNIAQNGLVSRKVNNPSLETVNTTISDLLAQAKRNNAPLSANTQWQKNPISSTSMRSTFLAGGRSSRYLPNEMYTVFRQDQSRVESLERQTIFTFYLDRPLTISVEPPSQPADMFSAAFTKAKLDERVAAGEVGANNPTAYVSSVTYGQFKMISFTGTGSMGQLQEVLDEVLSKQKTVSQLSPAQQSIWENAEVKVYSYGGPRRDFAGIVSPSELNTFTGVAQYDELRPVEYTLTSLSDGSRVVLSEGSDYFRKECTAGVAPADTAYLSAAMNGAIAQLSWSPVNGATSYRIDRKAENENWVFLNEFSANNPASYSEDTRDLKANSAYAYRVRTMRDGAASPGKQTIIFTLPASPNLSASWTDGYYDSATLTWNAVTGSEGYSLEYMAPNSTSWTFMANVSGSTTQYGVMQYFRPGTSHRFRIINTQGGRQSLYSETSLSTPTDPYCYERVMC
jgi:Thiol-activated cytolysin